MFRSIYLFELRYGLRKAAAYIYFFVFFTLTLFIGLAAAGFFNKARVDSILVGNSAVAVSGVLLSSNGSIFSILVSLLLISIIGTSIQRDYKYNIHPLFFTKPLSKFDYFFGRFLGGLSIAIFVFTGLLIGYISGTLYGYGKPVMGDFHFWNYVQPFLIFTIPNVVFLGVLFFSLVTFLRNVTVAYVVAIVLMVFQIIGDTVSSNIDNKWLAGLLEPSGAYALKYLTEYWSPVESNTRLIPLEGILLYNRVLWISLSVIITAVSYYRFSFSQFLQPLTLFKRKDTEAVPTHSFFQTLQDLPSVTLRFDLLARWRQIWALTGHELRKTMSSLFFIVVCFLILAVMILSVNFMNPVYEASTYLVTYKVLENIVSVAPGLLVIFVLFYSGTVLFREKENQMDELTGAAPVSNGVLFLYKMLTFSLVSLIVISVACVIGILFQLYYASYHIDWMQYLIFIFRSLCVMLVFIAFSFAIQVFVNNKALGRFILLIPVLILPIVFGILEWNNDLYEFNSTGASRPYSDMNGYGGTFIQWPFYRLYWFSISAFLMVLAILLYPRGKDRAIKARWRLSKQIHTSGFRIGLVLSLLLAAATGGFIYYQISYYKDDTGSKETEKSMAQYEKKYGRYKNLMQPRISGVFIKMDIYPDTKELHVAGEYVMRNRTDAAIDTIYFDYTTQKKSPYHYDVFALNRPCRQLVHDSGYGIRIMKLEKPLLPGDSMVFNFDMRYVPRSMFDDINSPVVSNGTFINNSIFPTVGYNEDAELSQNTARAEYGLPPKPRMPAIYDSAGWQRNYISADGDWVRFEAIMSTAPEQIAIAPGYLQKEWIQNGRRYFHYKMDSPILNFYSFQSAAYEVKKDKWHAVNVEIYYQKGHEYNLDRMIKSIKRSLDYYTASFGPYQHRQVRIIEFPRYASFAQSFPNTIPYSEEIGFITRVEEGPDKIDLPFYVTAHELAHQWWGHQVVGANVQGSALMSETMSQYGALMVMEKEYGKTAMRKFLKYEMDKYLQGRAFEWRGELPLMLCENQQYIHYNKGSIVMYALKDFIGEERMNAGIRAYLQKNRFAGPPYSTAMEFVSFLREAAPDSLKYLVTDMFERITLYENYVKSLKYIKQSDGTYKVTLALGCAKFNADSIGKLKTLPVSDWMDVGIFGEKDNSYNPLGKVLLMKRIFMDSAEKTFEFTVPSKPESAGIDPYCLLIDRVPDNNICRFGATPAKPELGLQQSDIPIMISNDE